MAILIMYLSWPVFVDAWTRNEVSTNAGGLIIWPARLMVPIGFFLLIVQAHLRAHQAHRVPQGLIPDPSEKHVAKTAEEELAEEILRARGDRAIAEEIEEIARRPTAEKRHDRLPDREHRAADVRGAGGRCSSSAIR